MFICYDELKLFINERIAKLRIQKNISARDMSLTIGQGTGYINHIERQNNMPSMEGLFYISEFFKISPKDFFDDEKEAPALLSELVDEAKKLDERSVQNLLEFIKTLKK